MEAVGTQLWWILGLPLLGFLVQAFLGGAFVRALGPKNGRAFMGWIAFFVVFVPFLMAAQITLSLMAAPEDSRTVITALFDWIKLQSLVVPFELECSNSSAACLRAPATSSASSAKTRS